MNRVFLAAGHYPASPGAGHEGFFEHDEAAVWVKVMVKASPDLFSEVPTGDLKSKTKWVNTRCQDGDVAVELHFNSAVDADGKHVGSGSVTLYMPGSAKGKELAVACQRALSSVYPPDRGVVEGWYRGDQSKGAYYFLERTTCPAVILEPEFVHRADVIRAGADACRKALTLALRFAVRGELPT